jgi:hypothetical protein
MFKISFLDAVIILFTFLFFIVRFIFLFILAFVEWIYKCYEIVILRDSRYYKLKDNQDNAHKTSCVRKSIWDCHYLSSGYLELIIHQDIYRNEWGLRSIFIWQILH